MSDGKIELSIKAAIGLLIAVGGTLITLGIAWGSNVDRIAKNTTSIKLHSTIDRKRIQTLRANQLNILRGVSELKGLIKGLHK